MMPCRPHYYQVAGFIFGSKQLAPYRTRLRVVLQHFGNTDVIFCKNIKQGVTNEQLYGTGSDQ